MPVYTGFMSLVCGVIQAEDPAAGRRAPASARTAAKNSRGTAVVNRGHTYRWFQSRWMSVTHRAGMTWSEPTGSRTLRVAATCASARNCPYASASAACRSGSVCSRQPAP